MHKQVRDQGELFVSLETQGTLGAWQGTGHKQGRSLSILDLMEEDEDFDGEQVILDEYEEKISNILDCLYVLLNPAKPAIGVFDDLRHSIDKCLSHIDRGLARILDKMKKVKSGSDMDHYLVEQPEE